MDAAPAARRSPDLLLSDRCILDRCFRFFDRRPRRRIDQFGRCSDPDYFACGNLLHPVETAGWCWAEGRRLATHIHAAIDGRLPGADRSIAIDTDEEAIRYFTPQRIVLPPDPAIAVDPAHAVQFQLRFNRPCRGKLRLQNRRHTIQSRSLHARPETRQLLTVPLDLLGHHDHLSFDLEHKPGNSS